MFDEETFGAAVARSKEITAVMIGNKIANCVQFTAQSKTTAQKSMARQNIGAAQISPTDSDGASTGMLITY